MHQLGKRLQGLESKDYCVLGYDRLRYMQQNEQSKVYEWIWSVACCSYSCECSKQNVLKDSTRIHLNLARRFVLTQHGDPKMNPIVGSGCPGPNSNFGRRNRDTTITIQ